MSAKLRLKWRPAARADLVAIVKWIVEDNPMAAQALKDEIESKAETIRENPKLYKASLRVQGCRECAVRRNYILLFRERDDLVEIVNVVHARRQWPPVGDDTLTDRG